MTGQPLLTANELSKSFGATHALTRVSLALHPGERLAILGENGAGKSTLMKILAGVFPPDTGTMTFLGTPYQPQSPAEAAASGLAIVYQEPVFFPHLTVLENVFTGRELRTRWGTIRWQAMADEAITFFESLGLSTNLLYRRMGDLSLGTQQLILIAHAMHQNARVLILDEPTSILTDTEAATLFELIDRLTASSGGVLYITHRIKELQRVADRVVVLKDGQLAGEVAVADVTEQALINLMSGRHVEQLAARAGQAPSSTPLLTVEGLSKKKAFHDISFSVTAGEIVGFYGLIGAGRTEIALTLFGALLPDSGTMALNSHPFAPGSPIEAIKAGVAYVPEDRKTQGIFPSMDTGANLSAAALPGLARLSFIHRRAERAVIRQFLVSLAIKAPTPTTSILNLSGGSQQKVILARWLATSPRLLILDEPTRGIDIGTKTEIHRVIRELADRGLAIIVISSELPELLTLSDRVYVLRKGRIVANLPRAQASEDRVLRATMGVTGADG